MGKVKNGTGWVVVFAAFVLCTGLASASMLLEEPFDYANASRLAVQLDVAASGTWFGTGWDDDTYLVLNGDDSGNGTASLSFAGIVGSGGRLAVIEADAYCFVFYPAPVTGEGNSVYVSASTILARTSVGSMWDATMIRRALRWRASAAGVVVYGG